VNADMKIWKVKFQIPTSAYKEIRQNSKNLQTKIYMYSCICKTTFTWLYNIKLTQKRQLLCTQF